jgi:hypothetical protein
MDILQNFLDENPVFFFLFIFIGFISFVANWRLFAKCGKPGLLAIIPIINMFVGLSIVGRPKSHFFFFLIPVYGQLVFPIILTIELVRSFGKYHWLDYILAIVFNIFYALNLGLAYNEEYYGPVYGQNIESLRSRKPQLA